MIQTLWLAGVIVVLLVVAIRVWPMRRVIVFEFQRGLKYTNGRFVETLEPGRYWINPRTTTVTPVDVRPNFVTIPGQEVISTDGVTLKISLAAEFEISDPATAINKNAGYYQAFHLVLQMALRQIVAGEKAEAIVENRESLSARIGELTRDKVKALGVRLITAEIKDVMLPGELRRTFAQVVKAQKEGQAALERARSETAALRSLANAARMAEDNPNLLQLRALQMMADSSGNTVMLGVPGTAPVQRRKNGSTPSGTQQEETD